MDQNIEPRKPRKFLNGVEVRGTPKTVDLCTILNGRKINGPLEVWIASLVATLPPDQYAKFCETFDSIMRQRDQQKGLIARVVADIPMPNINR